MAKKPHVVRPEDAIRTREQRRHETDPTRRKALWLKAELEEFFGWINRHNGFPRRGRPKGSTRLFKGDDVALEFMETTAAEIGGEHPYTLARLAWESGFGPPNRDQEKTVTDRWTREFKRRHPK